MQSNSTPLKTKSKEVHTQKLTEVHENTHGKPNELLLPKFYHFVFRLGWSGGMMVLDKLLVPGRLTNLAYSGTRAYCTCSRCGRGLFGHFFLSSITSLFFLHLSGKRPDID